LLREVWRWRRRRRLQGFDERKGRRMRERMGSQGSEHEREKEERPWKRVSTREQAVVVLGRAP
jgi:hypothetical protein